MGAVKDVLIIEAERIVRTTGAEFADAMATAKARAASGPVTSTDAMAEIRDAIEGTGVATADEYDVEAILRRAYDFQMPFGFRMVVTVDEFWEIVAASEKA